MRPVDVRSADKLDAPGIESASSACEQALLVLNEAARSTELRHGAFGAVPRRGCGRRTARSPQHGCHFLIDLSSSPRSQQALPRIPHRYIHNRQRKGLTHLLPVSESPTADRPSVLHSNLWLCSVKNLEEFGDSVSHPRVHVRLGALDMVVQVISEELDAVDGGDGLGRVGEVSGEQDYELVRFCKG